MIPPCDICGAPRSETGARGTYCKAHAPKTHVRFVDVGRERKSWVKQMAPNAEAIAQEAKKRAGIRTMARVHCDYDPHSNIGVILAGDRVCGRFMLEPRLSN